jgi:hypothetical protein
VECVCKSTNADAPVCSLTARSRPQAT